MNMLADVSPDFRWNRKDASVIRKVLCHEATPEAIQLFSRYAWRLTDYAYWFLLSTLWVSYTGWSDLDEWKRLFSSTRPRRETSIMKPSELEVFRKFPDTLTLYRAHRANERDWISYTLFPIKAAEFAARRGVDRVAEYRVAKEDVLCLFLRRGEFEVLVLDKGKAEFVRELPVVMEGKSSFAAVRCSHTDGCNIGIKDAGGCTLEYGKEIGCQCVFYCWQKPCDNGCERKSSRR